VLAGGALASDIGLVTLAADLQSDNARPIRTRLMPLVKEGFATSLTEAATRFAISHPAMGTILVGMATPQQFEAALAAVQKDPLPPAAFERLTALRRGVAGQPR
jgi:aryl-alcohol dehydrogenase-like predicted oxidoreductase